MVDEQTNYHLIFCLVLKRNRLYVLHLLFGAHSKKNKYGYPIILCIKTFLQIYKLTYIASGNSNNILICMSAKTSANKKGIKSDIRQLYPLIFIIF